MNATPSRLSAHHDVMDALVAQALAAARARDWEAYRVRFGELRRALVEHMTYEEETLYPALAQELGEAALAALRGQHEHLQQHFETLGAAAPARDPEGCIAEMEALARLLAEHHRREDEACYPLAARLDELPAGPPPPRSIDLRGLQPPEPMVRIFAALERSPREPLRAILPHEPFPLYGLLRERGFTYQGSPRADGGFEVLIEPV